MMLGALGCGSDGSSGPGGTGGGGAAGSGGTAGAGGSAGLATLTPFEGTPSGPQNLDIASGGNITVEGVYGDIVVNASSSDKVVVRTVPFAYTSSMEAATEAMNNYLKIDIQQDGPNVVVKSFREGGENNVGVKITLSVPAQFDGELNLVNMSDGKINPGSIDVTYLAKASALVMTTQRLGDCAAVGGATVTNTTVACDGQITISEVTNNVDVTAAGLELSTAISLGLASIDPAAKGGTVKSEDGDIQLTLPATGDYSVQATASPQGIVDFGTFPPSCSQQEAAANSKTLTCGAAGPNYVVQGGFDGVGISNVNVAYK